VGGLFRFRWWRNDKFELFLATNLTRVHESLKCTPAMALGITDRVWTIGYLIEVALATQPIKPVPSAPDRRKLFKVIDGGKN